MNLRVEKLCGGYRGKAVLHGVNFTLRPGEVVCLLGPNGCGKTTLFKMILRLLRPASGCIRLGEENIAGWSERRLARSFGYVPQAHTPPFAFLVRDVVLMARAAHLPPFGAPGRSDENIASEALAMLGILHLAGRRYTEISGGERQLVLIARALAQDAPWLILDEPAASLDLANQMRVLRSVADLAARGFGVLMTTHDPTHAFLCASRAVLMHAGRIVASDTPQNALTDDALHEAYGVPLHVMESDTHPGMKFVVPGLSWSRENR
jgi:iron complex transport system ATP-binding protein